MNFNTITQLPIEQENAVFREIGREFFKVVLLHEMFGWVGPRSMLHYADDRMKEGSFMYWFLKWASTRDRKQIDKTFNIMIDKFYNGDVRPSLSALIAEKEEYGIPLSSLQLKSD